MNPVKLPGLEGKRAVGTPWKRSRYMIYDYKEKEGYVSLWVGKCEDFGMIDNYLSTMYFDEIFDGDAEKAEQSDVWKKLFLPANRDRDCEEELKKSFNYEFFNQFEYDYGLSFDEDFREANVLDYDTKDLDKLFDGFSCCESFLEQIKDLDVSHLPECNTAIALYDFKYEGGILEAEHENIRLHFLGYFKYDN